MPKDYIGMLLATEYDEIEHHGVKGQKWGVRRQEKLQRRAEKKASKETKELLKAEKRRAAILSSPNKLYRHRNEFSDAEIQQAVAKMNMERKLRQLSMDQITAGSRYANAFLSYADTGAKAYRVYSTFSGNDPIKNRRG